MGSVAFLGMCAAAVLFVSKTHQERFKEKYLEDTPAAAINRGAFNEDTQQDVYRVADVYREKIQVWDKYLEILTAKQANTATPEQEKM